MKRTELLAIAVLLLPLGGCALNPLASATSPTIAKAAPAPDDKKQPSATSDLETAVRSAQAARRSGDLTGATRILSQLVLLAPDDARVVGEYGKTLAAQGRSDDAIAFLERATQIDPADWSLYSAEGVAYDQKGNYQAAQNLYGRALMLKPGEPSVLNNAALSHMQAGDLDGAEKLLRQATPGTPEFPRITENLALVQSLKAAQASKPVAEATPAPASAAAAPPPTQMASLTPPPAVSVTPPVASPAQTASVTPPQVAETVKPAAAPAAQAPVASAETTPVKPPVVSQAPATETAKSETVHATPAPKTAVATPAPHAAPVKPEAPAVKAPEKKIVQAPAAPKAATNPAQAAKPANGAGVKLVTTAARTPSSSSSFYVQAGSFPSEGRAEKAASTLDSMGAHVMSGMIDGHPVYRVRIGPFLNRRQANAAIEQAHQLGHADLVIVTE